MARFSGVVVAIALLCCTTSSFALQSLEPAVSGDARPVPVVRTTTTSAPVHGGSVGSIAMQSVLGQSQLSSQASQQQLPSHSEARQRTEPLPSASSSGQQAGSQSSQNSQNSQSQSYGSSESESSSEMKAVIAQLKREEAEMKQSHPDVLAWKRDPSIQDPRAAAGKPLLNYISFDASPTDRFALSDLPPGTKWPYVHAGERSPAVPTKRTLLRTHPAMVRFLRDRRLQDPRAAAGKPLFDKTSSLPEKLSPRPEKFETESEAEAAKEEQKPVPPKRCCIVWRD